MKPRIASALLLFSVAFAQGCCGPMLAQVQQFNNAALPDLARMLPNLAVVTPVLVRGGQPTQEGLLLLKNSGVKTIVDLRNEEDIVNRESRAARQLGLGFENIPMDVFNEPSEATITRFLKIVNDPEKQPVYVHCLHGQDRTGTMVAIYRLQDQGWRAEQAYQEMLNHGFRAGLVRLSDAVFDWAQRLGRPGARPSASFILNDIRQRLSSLVNKN